MRQHCRFPFPARRNIILWLYTPLDTYMHEITMMHMRWFSRFAQKLMTIDWALGCVIWKGGRARAIHLQAYTLDRLLRKVTPRAGAAYRRLTIRLYIAADCFHIAPAGPRAFAMQRRYYYVNSIMRRDMPRLGENSREGIQARRRARQSRKATTDAQVFARRLWRVFMIFWDIAAIFYFAFTTIPQRALFMVKVAEHILLYSRHISGILCADDA